MQVRTLLSLQSELQRTKKPKILFSGTKIHSYELIFYPNIEEDQTITFCYFIFIYFFDLRFWRLQWSSIVSAKSYI